MARQAVPFTKIRYREVPGRQARYLHNQNGRRWEQLNWRREAREGPGAADRAPHQRP